MPITKLPSPEMGMGVEELTNLMFRYYRELQYLLNGNLDSENVIEAGTVKADWVYAGNVTTDQLIAGDAKISTALIDNLVVGSNVAMGDDATISWSNVTNQPSIPSQYTNAQALSAWENSDYATHIDANGVYSGSFNGGMFNVNPTGSSSLPSGITIGGYYNNSWKGQALQIKFEEFGDVTFPGTVFSSDGGVPVVFNILTKFNNYVYFTDHVDFSAATVTGLSTTATFG